MSATEEAGRVPVVVWFSPSAEAAARAAAAAVGGRAAPCGAAGPEAAGDGVAASLRGLFASGTPIVAVMAAGIVIRALAPLIGDKRAEPAVVALAEDGSAAVPLLGGHRGANALARALAQALGGVAAVTTAGDVSLGVALDEPPAGWRLENPEDAKAAMAGLLAGRPARLSGAADWLAPLGDRVTRAPAPSVAKPSSALRRAMSRVSCWCHRSATPRSSATRTHVRSGLTTNTVRSSHVTCVLNEMPMAPILFTPWPWSPCSAK